MSKHGASSSSSPSTSSSAKTLPIQDIYQSFHAALTRHLLNQDPESNRLTQVQALRERLKTEGQELTTDDQEKIIARAQQQASSLIEAQSLEKSFAETQRVVNLFLEVIRKNMNAPNVVITPENVKLQLTTLLTQFDLKARARSLAVALNDRLTQLNLDIARLEVEKPVSASAPASSNAVPAPNQLEVAKAAKTQLEKDLEAAIADAQKPTDIRAELRDSFIAFAKHTTNVDKLLQAITYEVQFPTTDANPTDAQIDVSNTRWQAVEMKRQNRLLDVEKNGGSFSGIRARVADWNAKIPVALSSKEMAARDAILPYRGEEETPENRQERIKQVSGLPFRREQMDQKAVARNSGSKKNQHVAPVAKQLHELDDDYRSEFETLGIKPYPKNKQRVLGAVFRTFTGAECWNEQFEEEQVAPKSPNPPRRTSMETGQDGTPPVPIAYPPRRAHYTAALTPQLQRHLQLGANSGQLVGRWVKKGDKYSEKIETPEMLELTAKLAKVKI